MHDQAGIGSSQWFAWRWFVGGGLIGAALAIVLVALAGALASPVLMPLAWRWPAFGLGAILARVT